MTKRKGVYDSPFGDADYVTPETLKRRKETRAKISKNIDKAKKAGKEIYGGAKTAVKILGGAAKAVGENVSESFSKKLKKAKKEYKG